MKKKSGCNPKGISNERNEAGTQRKVNENGQQVLTAVPEF